jgi:hypothetical protein
LLPLKSIVLLDLLLLLVAVVEGHKVVRLLLLLLGMCELIAGGKAGGKAAMPCMLYRMTLPEKCCCCIWYE